MCLLTFKYLLKSLVTLKGSQIVPNIIMHGLLYIWTGRQKSPCTIEGIHKNGYKSEISQSNSSKLSGYKLLTSGRHIN